MAQIGARPQLRSASSSILPSPDLYFSLPRRFLFSARCTGRGVPNTARDAAFTTLVAVNFLALFFGMDSFNHDRTKVDELKHTKLVDGQPLPPLTSIAL